MVYIVFLKGLIPCYVKTRDEHNFLCTEYHLQKEGVRTKIEIEIYFYIYIYSLKPQHPFLQLM